MMDTIVVLAPVIEHVRTRAGAQAKIETALSPLAARLEAHLHDALRDRRAIAKSRYMSNGIVHLYLHFIEKNIP
jgi:hypothetical protein